eukprot:scaffold139201_cov15-Tisochrysis_lutea.AAC.1
MGRAFLLALHVAVGCQPHQALCLLSPNLQKESKWRQSSLFWLRTFPCGKNGTCRHVALSMRGQVQIAAQTPPLAYLSVWTGSWGTSRNPPKQSWFNNAEPPVSRTFCQVCVPNVLVYARQVIACPLLGKELCLHSTPGQLGSNGPDRRRSAY